MKNMFAKIALLIIIVVLAAILFSRTQKRLKEGVPQAVPTLVQTEESAESIGIESPESDLDDINNDWLNL